MPNSAPKRLGPLERSFYGKHLEAAYTVINLEEETAKLVEKGFQVILSIIRSGQTRRGAVYIDTRSRFSNFLIELIQAN